jgi:hypothetical protein
MFALSVLYGEAGLPYLRPGRLQPRFLLGLHCLVTGNIATVAVALALAVEHGSQPLDVRARWLVCGALAAYFLLGMVASVAVRGVRLPRVVFWLVAGLALPVGLGFAQGMTATLLVWCLAALLLVHVAAVHRLERR